MTEPASGKNQKDMKVWVFIGNDRKTNTVQIK